ncbi:MAG TPA: ion channel [Pseudomonadales bacterium]|nr:ion channel [Pseudomonadales bacterium]
MKNRRFFNLIGIGGVAPGESAQARVWARYFDIGLFPVAIFALLAWYANKREITFINPQTHIFSDWLLWGFFVVELVTLLCLTNQRWRYLRDNWFNLVVIIVAMPALWGAQELGMLRAVRFALVVMKLANLSDTIRVVLSRNNLGLTVLAAWIFVFCAGVIMTAIEPGFKNIEDGMWWAWVTVTTVGYGDVVPVTTGGRLLAGLVMLVGLGIFSLITASFSAFFVTREETKLVKKEEQVLEKEVQVLVSEQKILGYLQKIEERLHALEKEISNKNDQR